MVTKNLSRQLFKLNYLYVLQEKQSDFLPFVIKDQTVGYIRKL